jgi:Tol biopolymer transport system component
VISVFESIRRPSRVCALFAVASIPIFTLAVSSSAAPHRSTAAARMLSFIRVTGSSKGLYVARTDGSDLRRLARPAWPPYPFDGPRWSPDGSRIAFEGRGEIFVVSLNSHRPRQLTKSRLRHGFDVQPTWSPDGYQIAYANWGSSTIHLAAAIYRVRPNGTGLVRLTRRSANNETDPEWSPNGRLIAFSAREGKGTYVMNRRGGRRRRVARWGGEEAWSPDGKLIAIARENPAAVYVVRSDGTGLRTVARPHGEGTGGLPDLDGDLAWSPNGRTLAWSSCRSDGSDRYSCAIWLANLGGTAPRQLTSPSPDLGDGEPSWAPDGSVIAFSRASGLNQPPGPSEGIYLVHPDGTGLEMVPRTVGGSGPAWRP